MDRRIFFTMMTFSVLLGFLYLVYSVVSPFLDTLGWAAVIGITTFPLYRRLRNLMPGRETVAAAVMTPAVAVTLVVPFVGFLILLGGETTSVYQYLERATSGGTPLIVEKLLQHPRLAPLIARFKPALDSFDFDLQATVLPALKQAASYLIGYSTAIIKNFFLLLIKLGLMIITLFFIYRDGEAFLARVLSVLPLDEDDTGMLRHTVKRVLSAVVYGIFLTCLVQGFLGGVGFWFCGLPSPVVFGGLMAVAALIPVVGTALIWFPGALYLFLQGEVLKGVFLMVWGALVVGMIDNLIRPVFISGKAHLPILVIAVGVLGGVFSFGPLGVVAGPIILAVFLAFFDIYSRRVFPGETGSPAEEAEDGNA
ncbi:MAG: AI-2E family transporter [Geobacteraceae bacterium]|nr:AI-2E family transporter [Geobacteraceae bacterium]